LGETARTRASSQSSRSRRAVAEAAPRIDRAQQRGERRGLGVAGDRAQRARRQRVALERERYVGWCHRRKPSPTRSTVRDAAAAGSEQMPPIATEHVDDAGVAAVRAWIHSLN